MDRCLAATFVCTKPGTKPTLSFYVQVGSKLTSKISDMLNCEEHNEMQHQIDASMEVNEATCFVRL